MSDLIVAITGASGAVYATRLLQICLRSDWQVHLTCSPAASQVFFHELGIDFDLKNPDLFELVNKWPPSWASQPDEAANWGMPDRSKLEANLHYHHFQDFNAGMASGSFRTRGMVICPCSMGTLASLANGISSNLIHRAAGVHLKERRKLVVVPRETPLGTIQLESMKRLADAGAMILPAMPGLYHQPRTILDLVDFVVGRVADQMDLPVELIRRWGESDPSGS